MIPAKPKSDTGKYAATSPLRVTAFKSLLLPSRDLIRGYENTSPAVNRPTKMGATIPVAMPCEYE